MIHPVGWAREPLLAMSSYASVDTMEARSGRVLLLDGYLYLLESSSVLRRYAHGKA